jgi:thiosulfate reductase/polysulfide reductase chain A
MSDNTIYSVCGMCGVRCPIEVGLEDGSCRSIQGNRQAAGIRGALCVRGAAGIACVQDDERPQFPMLRKGGRGEGNWQRVSWEEAFDHAAAQIAAVRSRHGGRSILWSDTGGPFSDLRQALVRGLGSPNYASRDSFLAANTQQAALSLFGFTPGALVYDLKNAREVVLQTRNLFESINVQQANDLLDGLANGGRLTVIDIRATVTAGKADRFLMIRPGTDYALNLAVIHTLLARKLYNESYASQWIEDLEELRRVVSPCTPEFAEAETGIKAADIVALAEDLAKAAPKVIWHPGGMTARYADSFFVCRTAYLINALLGAIGARGGLPLAARPADLGRPGLQRLADLFPVVGEKRADGVGGEPGAEAGGPGLLPTAYRAMQTGEPYPIKAYVVYQHDPLTELPEPDRLKTIFGSLDFLLCVTSAWTETAWQADLVLPLSPYLERDSIVGELYGLRPGFLLRRRCTPPRFDTRADWEIVGGLARRLGLEPLTFAAVEDIWRYQLKGTGVALQDFEAKGFVELAGQPQYDRMKAGFRFPTASGKIEVVNGRRRELGLPNLAPYTTKPKPPAGSFRLTIGGCSLHVEGHTVNNPLLFKQMPENVLWMNLSSAAGMGLTDGETVAVSGPGGSERIKVKLTEFIHPEAVFMVRGFGRSLPVESRAQGRGLADTWLMAGGLEQWIHAGGPLALQEHFVAVTKIAS